MFGLSGKTGQLGWPPPPIGQRRRRGKTYASLVAYAFLFFIFNAATTKNMPHMFNTAATIIPNW